MKFSTNFYKIFRFLKLMNTTLNLDLPYSNLSDFKDAELTQMVSIIYGLEY